MIDPRGWRPGVPPAGEPSQTKRKIDRWMLALLIVWTAFFLMRLAAWAAIGFRVVAR